MSLLAVNTTAPDFSAKTDTGATVKLSELCRISNVALVFYPGDDTPGCTKQLCTMRDSMADLAASGCAVLGVNPAGEAKHSAFVSKFKFPFPLIVDAGGAIAKAYGCRWLFGITIRTVYVIDKNRTIVFAQRGAPAVSDMMERVEGRG
jgi:peroxiredoxin Q/BCP